MEKTKTSKKALQGLIKDSMQDALKNLELPPPGKKAKKLLSSNAKKLASIFANVIKRQDKKKRKAAKFMERAVSGKSGKNPTIKKAKSEKIDVEST